MGENITLPLKVEVVADSTQKWCGNGLTFDSEEKAEDYARDLMSRWTLVQNWRIIDANGTELKRMHQLN